MFGIILSFGTYLGLKYFLVEPNLRIIGEDVIQIEVGKEYEDKGAIATYRLFDISNSIATTSNVNTNKIGKYEVTYEVEADNQLIKAKRIVNVVDIIPPKLTLNGEKNVIIGAPNLYVENGYKAEDNYDGDLTSKVKIDVIKISDKEFEKVYQVEDTSGNSCREVRKIEVRDIVPPEIFLEGNVVENMYIGSTYEESGATAKDDVDGDLTSKITVTNNIDSSKAGQYTVEYMVKDNGGNITKTTRRVEVVPEPPEQGIVFLTFDDGPSESTTPYILDILKEENVKATFFIINYSDNTEYLVKRIVDEGHSIAIHGYSHDYAYIYQSEDIYMENLSKLRKRIKETTGVDTVITRFPGGSSNTVSDYNPGIMTKLTRKVIENGYRYFDWNVSSGDAGGARSSYDVYSNVVSGLKRNRRNVVLMHDFSGNEKTMNALRDIIHYIKNEGYNIEKITKTTPMITHGVAN